MRRLWLLLLAIVVLLFCVRSHATVYSVTPSSALQTVINGTVAGDTVSFAAGTYTISAKLNLKCGVTYTGPVVPFVVGTGISPTAILNSTFTSQSGFIFNLASGSGFASPCTQTTTIQYLKFENNPAIYVQTSYTNLVIQYNQVAGVPCCALSSGIEFDGSVAAANTTQNLTNTLVQWNQVGDASSCISPTNSMTDVSSGGHGADCHGITVSSTVGFGTNGSSTYGLKIINNQFYHMGEGISFPCPNPPGSNPNNSCEPATGGLESPGSGVETRYVTMEFNDFNQIHAAPLEEQPQITQGVVYQYNSEHDWFLPHFHSYGQSFACCAGESYGQAQAPYLNASNNVVIMNTTPTSPATNYAYGSEAWGLNATYNNNLYQGLNTNGHNTAAIAWGYGVPSLISNNTICGTAFNQPYIVQEFSNSGSNTPTITGNVTGAAPCTAKTSVAPTISPAAGSQSYPLTVTMTDPGFTSGAQPLGNHSIYYTTDGSTPTVSSALYTGPITLSAAATVKAIGMWGSGANATSYPAGYGFVPSSAVSAAYTGGSTPTCSAVTAGSSASQIQTALNNCASAGGGTVNLGAGAYSISGTITIPCKVSLSGPVITYSQTHYQTAILTNSVNQPFQTTPACGGSTPYQHLSYIECNGNHINNGGGCVNVVAGTNGFVVDHNWIHGSYTTSNYDGGTAMAGVLLSGGGGTINNPTQNVQITLNEFGSEQAGGDCGAAMQGADTEKTQGLCVGILNDTFSKNVSWDHNIFHNMEQGAKVVEVTTNQGASTNSGNTQNLTVSYNWFSGIHRIDFETQSNYYTAAFPSSQTINYNLLGDRDFTANTDPQGGNGQYNYDLSIANGCVNNLSLQPYCSANIDFNADIQALSTSHGSGNEIWGDANTHGNYGLIQGYVAFHGGGYQWSDQGNFQFNNNTFNIYSGSGASTACNPGNGGYWNNENPGPVGTPTCTGNTFSSTGTGTYTSAAPTISPASGSFSGTQTVTLTNTGTNRDANTSIWYTTDGSTPVPGTSKLYTAPFTVTSPSTVKAVGMWGAINQPYSYPTNYGYVPSAVVTAAYTSGGQYYLSTTGSDSNSGTSPGSPWLSPNHAVNCGDTITAAPGNYSAANFYQGKWGTVTCPAANNVAWLQCATFDACKISATTSQAMFVSASFWGVSGWEATDSWSFGNCFYTQTESSQSVHHVIFANDIANGCAGGGFVAYNSGGAASDYYAYIGDIAYGTGTSSSVCASGFSMGFLKQLDANAGTHLYVADTYAWGNVNPANPPGCASTAPTDGEGLIYDTLNSTGFTGQAVAENNIYVGNDGRGIEGNNNTAAHFIFDHNTTYGNNQQAGQAFPNNNGELYINQAGNASVTGNLAMTNQATTGGSAIYAASVSGTGSGISITGNWLYSAAGNTTQGPAGDFSSNVTGTNPAFASTTIPGAPNCSGTASVTACVASLIAGFTPTNASAKPYGYQPVSNTSTTNANFPQWLCSGGALIPGFPAGLVTPGCGGSGTTPTLTGGFQTNAGNVNTLAVGAAPVQQVANGTYSDGNPRTLPDSLGNTAVWSSSNTAILSVGTTGSIACVGTGTANSLVTSSPGGVPFNVYTWTCTTGSTPTLQGGFLTGSANTQIIGTAAIPFTSTGTYSDGVNRTMPDSFGNSAVWTSSNSGIMTVSGSGVANCVSAGTANVQVTSSPTSKVFNVWTMTCSNPTQSGGNLTNPGSVNKIAVGGGTVPFGAVVFYSNSPAINPLPDGFGNIVNSWSVIPGSSTCGTVNSSGVFTPTTAGTCNVKATCTACLVAPTQWTMTVTASATVVSVALTTTAGVTGLLIGNTNQLTATATYSDATTTNCTTTDSHGNTAGTWISTTPAKATVSSSGLVTGVAAGSTTFTAICGGITSSALPLTILPNGVYTIKATGPWKFTGKVHF